MPKIIIASGPVIVENNRVLVNKHGDTPFWKFCGGRIENLEESLADAARREAKEELGITLRMLNDQPYIFYTTKKANDGSITDVILVHFLAERVGEILPGTEIREWKWLDLHQLPADLGPNIIPALKYFGFLS